MNIDMAIKALAEYGLKNNLIEKDDFVYTVNQLCQVLNKDSFEDCEIDRDYELEEILCFILDWACENSLCEDSVVYRDLFDTKLMGVLTPRPSQVIAKFNAEYEKSPKDATDYYYNISRKTDYITIHSLLPC